MDEQLVIDSSGAWVRKTAQVIAEKPLLSSGYFGLMSCNVDHTPDDTNDKIDACSVND